MKTTEQVCREYGFEYAPMRITFKKKIRLRDLTPRTKSEREFLRRFVAMLIILFILVIGSAALIGLIAS